MLNPRMYEREVAQKRPHRIPRLIVALVLILIRKLSTRAQTAKAKIITTQIYCRLRTEARGKSHRKRRTPRGQ